MDSGVLGVLDLTHQDTCLSHLIAVGWTLSSSSGVAFALSAALSGKCLPLLLLPRLRFLCLLPLPPSHLRGLPLCPPSVVSHSLLLTFCPFLLSVQRCLPGSLFKKSHLLSLSFALCGSPDDPTHRPYPYFFLPGDDSAYL